MGEAMTHGDACKLVMQWLSKYGCRLVTLRPVGQFVALTDLIRATNAVAAVEALRKVRRQAIGVTGEADVQAILPPCGRAVGVEVKVGPDTPSSAQLHWAEKFTEVGGVYVLAHFGDPEEAKARIKAALLATRI